MKPPRKCPAKAPPGNPPVVLTDEVRRSPAYMETRSLLALFEALRETAPMSVLLAQSDHAVEHNLPTN